MSKKEMKKAPKSKKPKYKNRDTRSSEIRGIRV
jgi:hypothetical protein